MDTFREFTDGSQAAATESQFHKVAYNNEAYNASRPLFINDSTNSNQLEQKGLLPGVTLSNAEQTITSATSTNTAGDATSGSRAEIPVDVRRQINTLSNSGNGGLGYSEQVNRRLRDIADRHGVDGFNRMIGVLDALSNGDFSTYRHDLRNNRGAQDEPLNNLERLANPEFARQVLDLNTTMRQEGYTQRLSIEDLSPEHIRMLSTQPEQRRAFIEFNNEARHSMGPAFFLQEVPEMLDALPSEQLRLYRIWNAERKQR